MADFEIIPGRCFRCEKCGGTYWNDDRRSHRCPPAWHVWGLEYGEDDAMTIHGRDAESAAVEWARQDDWDSTEYSIASGRARPTVCVKAIGSDEISQFVVSGESVPSYTATAVPTPDPER